MTDDNTVSIRSLQHYMYCPHRWGLIEMNQSWAENYFVVKANLLHKRVHTNTQYVSRAKKVFNSVRIWNDDVGIYGIADCIEERSDGLYVVEYKPKKPASAEFSEEDAIQVFAQKLCVDFVFQKPCKAEIYYADVKKHIKLPFDKEYDTYYNKVIDLLGQIREHIKSGVIPPVKKGQYCGGCSMKDMCIPKMKLTDTRSIIGKIVEDI